ncbi:hypothetical protein SAMN05421690_10291 [Nitrosomonas sp. Nm51]|nr:hypothetical protein SAMN05421690_10291 [Nitrosomonas sp. Nm51]
MLEWFKKNESGLKALSIFIGVIVPLTTLSFSAVKYVETNNRLASQKTFENYHLIIGRIGGGEHADIFVAASNVYELRNYPEYREFSIRLLQDMKDNWASGKNDVFSREIDLTIEYLSFQK